MVDSGASGSTASADDVTTETGFIASIINEIIYSPLNLLLVTLIAFLIYKIFKSRSDNGVSNVPAEPELPKLRKDFTIQELKKYDGNQADGRVLVAVNGHVYDVRNKYHIEFTLLCFILWLHGDFEIHNLEKNPSPFQCGAIFECLHVFQKAMEFQQTFAVNSHIFFFSSYSSFAWKIGDERSTILRSR